MGQLSGKLILKYPGGSRQKLRADFITDQNVQGSSNALNAGGINYSSSSVYEDGTVGKELTDLAQEVDGKVDKVTGKGLSTNDYTNADKQSVADMLAQVFPLEASYASHNSGIREVGTAVTPTVVLNITRKGADVSASATINNPVGTTVGADNKSWTAPAVSDTDVTYSTSVTQAGQTKSLSSLKWSFTYYRYRGEVSSVPTDWATAIKALSTKELSVASTLGTTALNANKYYLFAVKGTPTLVVRHAATDAVISGCQTGTCSVSQENDSSKTNTYSYVLVPASSANWSFKITNS